MASISGGVVHGPPPPTDRGWGGGDGPDGRGSGRRTSFIGLVILLVSTFIVFSALLIAFLARRAMGDDWISMHKPHLLWVNTAVLILSSIVLDKSRRASESARPLALQSLVDHRDSPWRRLPGGPVGCLEPVTRRRSLRSHQPQQQLLLCAHRGSRGPPDRRNDRAHLGGRAGVAAATGPRQTHRHRYLRHLLALSRWSVADPDGVSFYIWG